MPEPRTFKTVVVPGRALRDDEVLTQYGRVTSNPDFFGSPHGADAGAMSLMLGEVSLELACLRVQRQRPQPTDTIRRTTVGLLRAGGFIVDFTPEEFFPEHVSVTGPGRPHRWHAGLRAAFKEAFATYSQRGHE